jgi:predicted phosphate transport protein (TIGR00153 family)
MRLPGFTADKRYFDMFSGLAARVVTVSDLLSKIFDDPRRADELVPQIKDVEHEADRLMDEVDDRLDRAFITPIDREDIHTLAYRLDNVIDLIDGTARRVVMFHISGTAPEHARRLAEVVARSAGRLAEAVRDIRKEKALSMHLQSVKQLEEEGDALYHDGVAMLFDGRHDPLDVIKWKELYDRLEEATDECQHTAQLVHSVALKYGGFGGPG